MMLGKFFTLFADDLTQVAKMVNTMSALLSAGCILFLFWTITHLSICLFFILHCIGFLAYTQMGG